MGQKTTLAIIGACILIAAYSFIFQPSNERDWNRDQTVLTQTEFDGDLAHVKNIRNNSYRNTTDYDVRHYDATYNLSELRRAWFIVEPFSTKGAAHTLVSFEFEGPRYLAVSVEIRKEQGESFSAVKGLFRQYELMYVIGDEEDLIKLRSNHRKDTVYLYPVNTTQEKARRMLESMLTEANELAAQPKFYNTLVSTCTTNIVKHANEVTPDRVPLDWRILAPAHADEYALEIGLLDVEETTINAARERHRINDRALDESLGPFSERIRK
jgi:hypothetical protein